jgi:hypothetical protein
MEAIVIFLIAMSELPIIHIISSLVAIGEAEA